MNNLKLNNFIKSSLLIILLLLPACNYSKVDQRNAPDGSKAKARKNLEEGKGVSLSRLGKGYLKKRLFLLQDFF